MSQKKQQFEDLKHSLQVVFGLTDSPSFTAETLVQMYFISNGINLKKDAIFFKDLSVIAEPFLTWYKNEMEAFFMFSKFSEIVDNIKLYEQLLVSVNKIQFIVYYFMLQIDDLNFYLPQKDNILYQHLNITLNAFQSLPFKRYTEIISHSDMITISLSNRWFRYCFVLDLPLSDIEM